MRRLFFHAGVRREAVEQVAAGGLGVAGVLLEKIAGAAQLLRQRGRGGKGGQRHPAAVQRFEHTDVARQVGKGLQQLVIDFGTGGLIHKSQL